jgi:hypothetical protein
MNLPTPERRTRRRSGKQQLALGRLDISTLERHAAKHHVTIVDRIAVVPVIPVARREIQEGSNRS